MSLGDFLAILKHFSRKTFVQLLVRCSRCNVGRLYLVRLANGDARVALLETRYFVHLSANDTLSDIEFVQTTRLQQRNRNDWFLGR